MTLAWYGHLRFKDVKLLQNLNLPLTILISRGIALLEYSLMVRANKIGFSGNDGPFSLLQLKIIQEVISISVFVVFTPLLFRQDAVQVEAIAGLARVVLAVYFFFRK